MGVALACGCCGGRYRRCRYAIGDSGSSHADPTTADRGSTHLDPTTADSGSFHADRGSSRADPTGADRGSTHADLTDATGSLELARIDSWTCVVGTGDFGTEGPPGQRCVEWTV
jgi:hypothetical protein